MSYLYGIDQQETANQIDRLYREAPGPDPAPGFFDGTLEAPFVGLAQGVLLKPTAALTGAAASVARAFDPDAAKDSMASWLEERHRAAVEQVQQVQNRVGRYGTAGQVLAGITEMIPQAIAGAAVAGPVGAAAAVGGLQGYADYAVTKAGGVDAVTALEKGAITGATMGVGALLPMSVGTKLIASTLFGAGSNVALGVAQRSATSAVLESGGYGDMAAQYKALDAQSMVVDAVLGSAFGVVGAKMAKPKAEQVAAALTSNEQLHVELDAQPGLHTTFESKAAGAEAMNSAIESMVVKGEMPDVSVHINAMELAPDPNKLPAIEALEAETALAYPEKTEPLFELPPWISEEAAPLAEISAKAEKPVYENLYTRMGDDISARYPGLEVPTPDGMRPFSEVLAEAKTAGQEAAKIRDIYEAAANCILRG